MFLIVVCILLGSRNVSAEVTIASFNAQGGTGQIKLFWTTASERKNWGFNIERSTDQKNWLHVGSNPSTKSQSPCIQNVMGAAYEFTDSGLVSGMRYYYRLQMYGQPCGDPNTYYEQIVSAVVNAPTSTPIPSRTASPTSTAISIGTPSSTPAITRLSLPTFTPVRTRTAAPSKTFTTVALLPSRSPPSPSDQNAAALSSPIAHPSPVVEERLVIPDELIESDEPAPLAARSGFIDSHDLIRGGMVIATALLAGAAFVCGTLVLCVILRPRR